MVSSAARLHAVLVSCGVQLLCKVGGGGGGAPRLPHGGAVPSGATGKAPSTLAEHREVLEPHMQTYVGGFSRHRPLPNPQWSLSTR